MNRKLFIRNIWLSIGTIVAGPVTSIFSENKNAAAKLKLGSFEGAGNKIEINGKFLDATTLENISAKIIFEKQETVFTKKVISENGNSYTIQNELGDSFAEKLTFKITAAGYKTFKGQLFINKNSVNIDTSIWQYNPNFYPENRPNNHKEENGMLTANFDFHLVKK